VLEWVIFSMKRPFPYGYFDVLAQCLLPSGTISLAPIPVVRGLRNAACGRL
jgi:hypothetical protein